MGVAGIEYDASAGILATALRYKSTIIVKVVWCFEFWLFLATNLMVIISQKMNLFHPEQYHVDLPWGLTGVTGSLMTFFVCFYNQHVFGRYNKLYNLTKQMAENCLEIAALLRIQVEDVAARRKIAKLVIASCFMFFYERTETEGQGNLSTAEYQQLKGLDLLNNEEISFLERHCKALEGDALPSFVVLQWSMEVMRHVTEEPEGRDDMLCGFYSRVYRVRKCQAEVVQILDLPMPFQYFHIMNLMLMLNLLLWAYSLGCQSSYFAPIIYMFVQMMFQGIRELSTALSDPFGDDEVDFPINSWMMTLYARMYGVLEDPHDITQCNLDDVVPLIHPDEAKPLINLYVDLEAEDEATDGGCCGISAAAPERAGGQARGDGYSSVNQRDEEYGEEYEDDEYADE